jgi:hypothetical protein
VGIGIAVLLAAVLLKKILFPSAKFDIFCKICGSKTGGLKCKKCQDTKQSWK